MRRISVRSARGAVLVHVAVVMVALVAFTTLTFDYGLNLVGRRQAQNAADAGALAGAITLSYGNPTDLPGARSAAVAAARQNRVVGQAPDVLTSDVTFPACPPGSPGVGGTCVKVDVFRTTYNRAGGSPLPTFFGNIVGVNQQGVKATATAQLLTGSGTADCVKPWGIPDKWEERRPATAPWTTTSVFNRYVTTGGGAGNLLAPADVYTPPSSGSAGSGFDLRYDYGRQLTLYVASPHDAINPGFFYPVRINPSCVGGNCYRDAIAGCSGVNIGPGSVLNPEPGAMIGPTRQGVQALIDQDPLATWSATANGGRGAPVGGCMASGACQRSPRLVAVPVFNVDAFQNYIANNGAGATIPLQVVKIIGLWLQGFQGNQVIGYLTHYPTVSLTGPPLPGPSSWASTIILVR